MIVKAIVAYSENLAIGKDNDLLWHLPADLKHFKEKTLGMPIVMGRKTWESIGSKPLPKRRNVVISRQSSFKAPGAEVTSSFDGALTLLSEEPIVFVVGGAQIYEAAMPRVDLLEITVVHAEVNGDAYFPTWDESEFELIASTFHPEDEQHNHAFTFKTYKRK